MLTNDAKQILDYLVPLFRSSLSDISTEKISEDLSISLDEADSVVNYLREEKYLTVIRPDGDTHVHSLSHKAFHYQEFDAGPSGATTNIFNGPISGSVIGSSGTITINYGSSFQEARDFIQSQSIPDKDIIEIEKVLSSLEALVECEAPIKKGFLSKFSDTLAKHHWLPELVGKLLFKYFTGI